MSKRMMQNGLSYGVGFVFGYLAASIYIRLSSKK